MGRNEKSFGKSALACAMSLVLAVGLMPLPTFAQAADGTETTDASKYTAAITIEGKTTSLGYESVEEEPTYTTEPAAVEEKLTYNAQEQALITPGTTADGTIQYAVKRVSNLNDFSNLKAPTEGEYSNAIPSGKEAGTYIIWYYIKGDENHSNGNVATLVKAIQSSDSSTADETLLPTGKTGLVFVTSDSPDDKEQDLMTAPEEAELPGETQFVYYCQKDDDKLPEDAEFSDEMATGIDAGTYCVWFTVGVDEGDEGGTVYPVIGPTKVSISKAGALQLEDMMAEQHYSSTNIETSVAEAMPGDAGVLSYTAGVVTNPDHMTVSDFSVDDEGVATAKISGGKKGDVITMPVTIESMNYEDSTVKAVVTLIAHTLTAMWLNGDGSVLQNKYYEDDEQQPSYDGEKPTKTTTAQYTYTFSKWDDGTTSGTVTTYKPIFSETVNEYTVTFLDENGTVLQSGKVAYGQMPEYTGKTPQKAATAKHTYTFKGWTPKIEKVTGDATYKATYTAETREYTVKFVNDDGAVLQSKKIAYGQTPKYTGKTPKKAATAKNTFTFKGWTPAVKKVTGDATYKATYASKTRKFAALLPKMTVKTKRELTITWNKVSGSSGYDMFFARCGSNCAKTKLKKVATLKGAGATSWVKAELKAHTAYKACVKAYVMQGKKKVYVQSSPVEHIFTSHGSKTYTNAKKVTVNKSRVTLSKGKTFKLKAHVTKRNSSKKLMPKTHTAAVRYLSSNKSVASVNSAGKIRAVGKGTCNVFAYAHSGVRVKVKVTVH